jgi:hypothetical protein
MKTLCVCLVLALAAAPAAAADDQSSSTTRHGRMFWSGIALAAAGVAISVVGVTVARVDDTSTGNAPNGAYQACLAQKTNPIYATNDCDGLKGKNRPLLWSGAAIGAIGAVVIIGSTHTSAQISRGSIRLTHTIRFDSHGRTR